MTDKPQQQPQTSGLPGIPWDAGEAAAVNEFLNTPLGNKWLWILTHLKPKFSFENTERAALSGAYIAGYEQVFIEISKSRHVAAPPLDVSRPSIDPSKD